jgi:hypothetical protein
MKRRFKKHYTVEEARALLPQVRRWLKQLAVVHGTLQGGDEFISKAMAEGSDIGGEKVNRWVGGLADLRDILREFRQREIQLKDVERGLIDFPAIIGGREVFLCWEQGEADIEHWHDLESGYAGREPL